MTRLPALAASLVVAALVAGCTSPTTTNPPPASPTPPGSGSGSTSGSAGLSASNPATGALTVKADNDNGQYYFEPKESWVKVGTTVTWTNVGSAPHTATADDGSWDTGNIAAGAAGTHTFNAAGDVAYHCTYHRGSGMTGIVHVQA